jgi:small nuclear ribonucleoprotein (snRNP)-like protein
MNETTGVLKDKSTGRTYNATVTKFDDTVSIVLEMQAPDAVPYQVFHQLFYLRSEFDSRSREAF